MRVIQRALGSGLPRRLGSFRQCSSSLPRFPQGSFFELRRDQVIPSALHAYLDEHNQTADERRKLLPGWKGTWKTEVGGSVHQVHHLYQWDDFDQRDRIREIAEDHPAWYADSDTHVSDMDNVMPLPSLRQKLSASESVLMLEATDALHACGLPGAAGFPLRLNEHSAGVAWEMRTYQLVLGYHTVPKFTELYAEGLRDKLAADDSGASELVTLLYSDCGPLNVVVELWRHESIQRAQESRAASRKAAKWKHAIGEIAKISTSFSTLYMRPLRASPWV